ncbi:glycosyltransferase [Diaphorobacter sp.]|uniref:glycosyltransferase n=1 Tax=Diaphorobacter sp. TaxID=1934310 RepID=UPI00258E9142|nr:glycosyltransferase [Diaphorobacter sp.]
MLSSKAKRALFFFPTDQMGGAERVTRQLVQAAVESRKYDEITCFVLAKESQGTLESLANDPAVKLVYTNASRELFGLVYVLKELWGKSYDFVFSSHAHLNAMTSFLRRLKVLKVQKLVARESTLIFERDFGWKGNIVKFLYFLYGAHDLVICQTARMAASLGKNTSYRLAKKTVVLSNPLDLRAFSALRDSAKSSSSLASFTGLKIVWCGRFSSVKDPFLAIDVLRSVLDSGISDVRLIMVGEGDLRQKIEAYAEAKFVSKELVMTGYKPFPGEIFHFCDVGLLTSKIEGFPNVILEMLAAGVKYVVATDCAGGLRSIPNVLVSDERNAAKLAQLITEGRGELQGREDLLRFLGARGPGDYFDAISQ